MADEQQPLPNGYRTGIITAITVLLGFSLLFLRFWSFEAPGRWNWLAVLAAALLGVSIALQFVALWRALQIADDTVKEYTKTLRWFLSAAIALFVSLTLAELAYIGFWNG